MADFPVPTQDVTGDDKQGMKRKSFFPLGTFSVHFKNLLLLEWLVSRVYEDCSQYMNTFGWIKLFSCH